MDPSNLPSPHNNYFHFALSYLPNARELIESQLPPDALAILKLETLQLVPGTFVGTDLRDRHADLLFSVELVDDENKPYAGVKPKYALIYFLLEHKSEVEPAIALQVLSYKVRIWEKMVRDELPLSPIVPLLVYHGERKWRAARSIEELIPTPEAIGKYQVRFEIPILDLSQLADDDLPGAALLQSALSLLKYSRNRNIAEKLRRILALLALSGIEPVAAWLQALGVYVMAVNKQIDSKEIGNIAYSFFPTQIEPGSLADRLIKQGLEQGLEQGREEGREEGKAALVVSIHVLQELLAEELLPESELKARPLDELSELVQSLQQRLRNRTN